MSPNFFLSIILYFIWKDLHPRKLVAFNESEHQQKPLFLFCWVKRPSGRFKMFTKVVWMSNVVMRKFLFATRFSFIYFLRSACPNFLGNMVEERGTICFLVIKVRSLTHFFQLSLMCSWFSRTNVHYQSSKLLPYSSIYSFNVRWPTISQNVYLLFLWYLFILPHFYWVYVIIPYAP